MERIIVDLDRSNLFFTSDTHFGHKNIIKYSNRPFKDLAHMDSELIKRWNSVVKETDVIIHCGDFAFLKTEMAENILKQLNGIKFLVRGNHDSKEIEKAVLRRYFTSISDIAKVKVFQNNQIIQEIIACHYAMIVWDKSHHGSWNLFGHSHGSLKLPAIGKQMDVGVDCNDYYPFSFQQIKTIMDAKEKHSVDHH